MAAKKSATVSSSMVTIKDQTSPPLETTEQQPAASPSALSSAPLNFKVDADFRRRFRRCAADADLKLNALLREALDAWEEKRGLKH